MAKRKIDNERESKEDAQATAGNLTTEEEKVISRSDSVKEQEAFGVNEKAEVKKKPKQVEEKATLKNSQTTMDIMDNCLYSSSSSDSRFIKSSGDSCSGNVSGDNSSGKYFFDPLNLFGEKQSRGKLVNENEAGKKPIVASEEAGNARKRRNNIGISRKEIELALAGKCFRGLVGSESDEFSDRNSVIDGYEADEQVKGQKSAAGGSTDVKIEAQKRVDNTVKVKALNLTSVKMKKKVKKL